MKLDLMIEGQDGVTWPQWQALAQACEQHGISTLFRSDHYLNLDGHADRGSLDALATLSALAAVTTKVRLGTMVSPASFRHPSVLAKLATTVDIISGGRFELGLGAGWHEREHAAYGFPYHDLKTRMDVLEEQLAIVLGSWGPGPFSLDGKHYKLDALEAEPKPLQNPHPPLIMGGIAGSRAAGLAARFATEYNTVHPTPEEARTRKARIDEACEEAGRQRLPFSAMIAVIAGTDEANLQKRVTASAEFWSLNAKELRNDPPSGWLVGTVDVVADQLKELESAGVSRVMCQHILHQDLEFVEILGKQLAPLL